MKEIVIHIGPGKTGTSALQAWFNKNRSLLSSNGVMYPSHDEDVNNISSGNYQSILSPYNSEWMIDKEKVKQLLKRFCASEEKTLLLSSEHFYFVIDELIELMPNAKFIYYLRHPLGIIESNYNQGIKRHNYTHKFSALPTNIPYLEPLNQLISRIGLDKMIIRPYELAVRQTNGIVGDFLSILKIEENVTAKKVNPSYSLEALEFKRLLNHFNIQSYTAAVDKVLQSYREGIESYSLIPVDTFEEAKQFIVEQLCEFIEAHSQYQLQPLIDLYKNLKQKPFYEQCISSHELENIWCFIEKEQPTLFAKIKKKIKKQPYYKLDKPAFYTILGINNRELPVEAAPINLPVHLQISEVEMLELLVWFSKEHELKGDLQSAVSYMVSAINLQKENNSLYNRFAYLNSQITEQSLYGEFISKLHKLSSQIQIKRRVKALF